MAKQTSELPSTFEFFQQKYQINIKEPIEALIIRINEIIHELQTWELDDYTNYFIYTIGLLFILIGIYNISREIRYLSRRRKEKNV